MAAAKQIPSNNNRKVKWVWRHPQGFYGILHIETNIESANYFAHAFPDYYELRKITPQGLDLPYKVRLPVKEGCDCKGYKRYKRCKHLEALSKLREISRL